MIHIELNFNNEEYVIRMILDKLGHITEAIQDVKDGYWRREKFLGNNLNGKKVRYQLWFSWRLLKILWAFRMKIVLRNPDIILTLSQKR